MPLGIWTYKYLFKSHVQLFGCTPKSGTSGSCGNSAFTLVGGSATLFSPAAVLFHTPSNSTQGFNFSTSSPALGILLASFCFVFLIPHPNAFEVAFIFGSCFHWVWNSRSMGFFSFLVFSHCTLKNLLSSFLCFFQQTNLSSYSLFLCVACVFFISGCV